MELIEFVLYIVVGAIKLLRYICLHVTIPHVVDLVLFDPIIKWVQDNLIGMGKEAGDDSTGPGDVSGV